MYLSRKQKKYQRSKFTDDIVLRVAGLKDAATWRTGALDHFITKLDMAKTGSIL